MNIRKNTNFPFMAGGDFLNQYEKSRNEAINTIVNDLDEFDHTSWIDIDDIIGQIKNELNNHSKTTTDLLFLWENVIHSKGDLEEELLKRIFLYLKKYEVSKKIYDEYDMNFKPSSTFYQRKMNYLLLANLLCDFYQLLTNEHKKLIVFNTILKLNDLNVSIIKEYTTLTEKLLAFSSLYKEKNLYSSLLKELQ